MFKKGARAPGSEGLPSVSLKDHGKHRRKPGNDDVGTTGEHLQYSEEAPKEMGTTGAARRLTPSAQANELTITKGAKLKDAEEDHFASMLTRRLERYAAELEVRSDSESEDVGVSSPVPVRGRHREQSGNRTPKQGSAPEEHITPKEHNALKPKRTEMTGSRSKSPRTGHSKSGAVRSRGSPGEIRSRGSPGEPRAHHKDHYTIDVALPPDIKHMSPSAVQQMWKQTAAGLLPLAQPPPSPNSRSRAVSNEPAVTSPSSAVATNAPISSSRRLSALSWSGADAESCSGALSSISKHRRHVGLSPIGNEAVNEPVRHGFEWRPRKPATRPSVARPTTFRRGSF